MWEKRRALWNSVQSVREFVDQVQKRARDLDLSERDLMDIIIAGFKQGPVRQAVLQKSPATLSELVECATLVEPSARQPSSDDSKFLAAIEVLTSRMDSLASEVKGMAGLNRVQPAPGGIWRSSIRREALLQWSTSSA